MVSEDRHRILKNIETRSFYGKAKEATGKAGSKPSCDDVGGVVLKQTNHLSE